METNIYIYSELVKVAQAIITEAANNGALTEHFGQGQYTCAAICRAYNNIRTHLMACDVRDAMTRLYPQDGIQNQIMLEHGAFKCQLPVELVFDIAAKFESLVPAKAKMQLEVRKEAEDVAFHYEFTLRSKNMKHVAKCVDNDQMRPVMNGVCVDLTKGHIYASDGTILASLAIEVLQDGCDEVQPMHRPVFPASMMAKLKPGRYCIDYLSDGNIRLSGNGVEFAADKAMNEQKYPNAYVVVHNFEYAYAGGMRGRVELPKDFGKFYETDKKKECVCTGFAMTADYFAMVKCGTLPGRVERVVRNGSTQDVITIYASGKRMCRFASTGVNVLDLIDYGMIRGHIQGDDDLDIIFCARQDNDGQQDLYFTDIDKKGLKGQEAA